MTFKIPGELTGETPFTKTHPWQWATDQETRATVTLENYLVSIGFITGTDRLSETDHDNVSLILKAWHRTAPHMKPRTFSECFVPGAGPGYYIQGMNDRRQIAQDIRMALFGAGWVYDVNPETTYFQVITQDTGRRVLFAKYQTIIGSRAICEITGD